MNKYLELLQAQGYELQSLILDGSNWNRCKVNGSGGLNGWAYGFTHATGVVCMWYGDWASGEAPKYLDNIEEHKSLTPEEIAAIRQEVAEKSQKMAEAKKQEQAAAKAKAKFILDNSALQQTHQYIEKKGLKPVPMQVSKYGQLIVPIYSPDDGQVCSLQFIDFDGQKKYLAGGQKGYAWIERDTSTHEKLCICEGWATGMSIHEATNLPVLVALDAKNMVKLASSVSFLKDYKEIIICADNDETGVTCAHETYHALGAGGIKAKVRVPKLPIENGNDWNDLHVSLGLEEVKRQILSSLPEVVEEKPTPPKLAKLSLENLKALPWITPPGAKKPVPPSQQQIALALYQEFGRCLMREERDIFLWKDTHWEEQSQVYFKSFIRLAGMKLAGGQAKDHELDAFYKLFLDMLDRVPHGQSFYKQAPNICNFIDGTLHLINKNLIFLPHSKQDLITWLLPYEYKAPRTENPVFQKWLDDTFEGDKDKLRAIAQIGGACLIPQKPIIAFFHGPSRSGKSTFAKICSAFIGEDNYSTVPPEEMHGFLMESMINKRVNIVTDISGGRIDQGVIKRIDDGKEVLINRKGLRAVRAKLPNLHIFCDNKLPKGVDVDSEAIDDRVVIVEMSKVVPEKDRIDGIELEILKAGPGAILDFFIKGLEDIVQCGMRYYKSENSKKHVKNWKLENDFVGQFLLTLEQGDIPNLMLEKEAKVRQKDVYDAFVIFMGRLPTLSRYAFFNALRSKGYQTVSVKGYDYIRGIKIVGSQESATSY